MIIFFGTRGATQPVLETDLCCPGCRKKGLLFVPVQNYFHVFFIPTFPIGRDFYPACPHCEAHFSSEGFEITPAMYEQAPIPWWTYSGIGLASIVVIIGTIL